MYNKHPKKGRGSEPTDGSVSYSTSSFTTSLFRSIIEHYIASDDVFNNGFRQAVYLKHTGKMQPPQSNQTSVESQDYSITGWRTELPAGPYSMSTSHWQSANTDGAYPPLSAALGGVPSLAIGVPPRPYGKRVSLVMCQTPQPPGGQARRLAHRTYASSGPPRWKDPASQSYRAARDEMGKTGGRPSP
ncbi:uncharacterized protein L3040_008419 [Drepanopeziza brunnea f. sp. 'multigermtubi']|uniref:uncharacterized protein n=1 Tax=Drepanopeziza brunnea f. sp. 'multigermtubi' TaxID=698441 RepID=UPI00239EBDE8|nr:hypothetical protein L3040_008419 [Drepanopeziza brunnea f. sp. 'multigermtubi']